jgi:hypothetical protein
MVGVECPSPAADHRLSAKGKLGTWGSRGKVSQGQNALGKRIGLDEVAMSRVDQIIVYCQRVWSCAQRWEERIRRRSGRTPGTGDGTESATERRVGLW